MTKREREQGSRFTGMGSYNRTPKNQRDTPMSGFTGESNTKRKTDVSLGSSEIAKKTKWIVAFGEKRMTTKKKKNAQKKPLNENFGFFIPTMPLHMTVTWTSGYGISEAEPFVEWGPKGGNNVKSPAGTLTFDRNTMCGAPARTVGWRDPGYTHTSFLKELWPNRQTLFLAICEGETLGGGSTLLFLYSLGSMMEEKMNALKGRMEGRMNVVEGGINTLKRRNIQEIKEMLQKSKNHIKGSEKSKKTVKKGKKEGETGMDVMKDNGGENSTDGEKKRETEAVVLNVDGFAGIRGQDVREENICKEEGNDENCDGNIGVAAIENVAITTYFSGDSVVGCGVYVKTEKKEERCPQGSKTDEEPLFPWVEGVELSTIEGNGTQGQTTRATDVFEVHPTVKTWQQKSKNLSWKNMATTLLRIVEGNRRSMLCKSWATVTQIENVAIFRENLKVDEKVFCFQPFSSYTVKSSFVGNKGATTTKRVVATRTDEVRDVNLRISQNWDKRIQEEWKSLEEDISYDGIGGGNFRRV
ncbi:hypothetical protein V8G54_023727 [Vigna mungo]|uniref:Uncharacterized protein n=1 Tax=Vigna mungo TaxID=3915 RepID=A0AAQ3N5G4_VIGMU